MSTQPITTEPPSADWCSIDGISYPDGSYVLGYAPNGEQQGATSIFVVPCYIADLAPAPESTVAVAQPPVPPALPETGATAVVGIASLGTIIAIIGVLLHVMVRKADRHELQD